MTNQAAPKTQQVAVNTGSRIVLCDVYVRDGKTYLKAVKCMGAAFVPTTQLKEAPFSNRKALWYETNAFGFAARTGDAALTVLDENGAVRAGYKGYI